MLLKKLRGEQEQQTNQIQREKKTYNSKGKDSKEANPLESFR